MKDNELKLQHFSSNSFMGIDSSNPVVIELASARKNQRIIKLAGDQGTRKTSTLTNLMYMMGASFNIEQKQLKNITDDAIDSALEFTDGGNKYVVAAGTSRMTVKQVVNDKTKTVDSPKEFLRKTFGVLGVSPMPLKEMAGKKQIEWFKETFGSDEEAGKKEKKLIADIDTLFSQRRDVNRDIKALQGALDMEPLYKNYEKSQERFKAAPSATKEKEKLDQLTQKKNEYDRATGALPGLKAQAKSTEQNIKELEDRLKREKDALAVINKRVADGEQYVKDNKSIVDEYEAANEAWLNLSKILTEHQQWKNILKKEKELNELTEAATQATGNLDKLRLQLLKLTKTYLPNIADLEMKIKTGLTDEEEGIYYQGKSLAQLSESELWGLFLQIWEQKDVQFIFCENISSLGSDAIGILNDLVKGGATVFASEMRRGQDEMEIQFETKIS